MRADRIGTWLTGAVVVVVAAGGLVGVALLYAVAAYGQARAERALDDDWPTVLGEG